jgi:hypothetical protein
MATKKIWLPQDIYQIKVTLRYTRPPIWRRLLVPAGLTLDALHDVLQVAMGWDDSHMHEFRIGQRRFGKPDPNDRLMGLAPIGNERTTHLYTVLGKVGAKAMYTYDFGDSWEQCDRCGESAAARTRSCLSALRRRQTSRAAGGLRGYPGLLQSLGSDPRSHPPGTREPVGLGGWRIQS